MRLLSKAKSQELRGVGLLRLDFNTEDEWRMKASVPTIKRILKSADAAVILSHRGRPEGIDPRFTLKKDALRLSRYVGKKVYFLPHFRFDALRETVKTAKKGSVFLLENLRFLPGEEKNDPALARSLASLADFYVNDAFAVSHRDDASVDAVTRYLPSYAGLELEKEVAVLSHVLTRPKHPLVLILGGAKAHEKLGVLHFFRAKADTFILGGRSANTLLLLKGVNVGRSHVDENKKDYPALTKVAAYPNLCLPVDWKTEKGMILDIGEESRKLFANIIRSAHTIVWNGPMGMIEKKKFEKGNLAVARAIVANKKAFTVTGGGETVMFLKKHRLYDKFSFISTGGGAMLDFLAGKKLPGLVALERNAK